VVGKVIARLRKGKGWTQTELANAASLSRGCIAAIEGGRDPGIKTLALIAEALGVEVKEFFEEEE